MLLPPSTSGAFVPLRGQPRFDPRCSPAPKRRVHRGTLGAAMGCEVRCAKHVTPKHILLSDSFPAWEWMGSGAPRATRGTAHHVPVAKSRRRTCLLRMPYALFAPSLLTMQTRDTPNRGPATRLSLGSCTHVNWEIAFIVSAERWCSWLRSGGVARPLLSAPPNWSVPEETPPPRFAPSGSVSPSFPGSWGDGGHSPKRQRLVLPGSHSRCRGRPSPASQPPSGYGSAERAPNRARPAPW